MKLVVTFHTTADAMAMEKACKEHGVPGRIIPVPRAISAGCGTTYGLQGNGTVVAAGYNDSNQRSDTMYWADISLSQ